MRSVAAISALSVAVAMPAPAPEPIIVPMASRANFQRTDGTADYAAVLASFNQTLSKYKKAPLPYYANIASEQQQQGLLGALGLKKRASANEALTDQYAQGIDTAYYGPGVIGSGDGKPQTFTLDFDTGSADIFIPGPQCGADQGCVHSTKYDQGGVDDHKTTSVTYGSGAVAGEDYQDDVAVAGLKVTNQTLISLTTAQGFSSLNSDGLMGMGFSTIAQTGAPTYFENLISQGVVSKPEFAFYLGRGKSGTQTKSELTLGGVDTSRYTGTPTAVAVTTPGYWQVALDSVQVNGASAGPTTAGQAAIDTGTTLILAPTAAFALIVAAIPGAIPVPMGTETLAVYPCNTANKYIPKIVFGGKAYAINPLDFNLGTVTSTFGLDLGNNTLANILDGVLDPLLNTYCLAGVVGGDIDPTENLYVVGDTFIKNWYSIFSYGNGKPTVSFAAAAGNQ